MFTSLSGNILSLFIISCFLLIVFGCASSDNEKIMEYKNLEIKANLVFFYYKDLSKAVNFYENTLGLPCVLDYGFAKICRISQTSYVGLVDEAEGMHSASEPKTVTLSFITDQVDSWYGYLISQGVSIHSPLKDSNRIPIRGFVAMDPEGYLLEFESFSSHEQNEKLMKSLNSLEDFYPQNGPASVLSEIPGIKGNIIWLYYKNLIEAQKFYENNLGLTLLVDQGFAKIYSSSRSGFIGLVDESRGLHRFTEEKAVNVSFFTHQIDNWYEHLLNKGLEMREPLSDVEADRVRAFVTLDTAGYYLEFDKFIKHKDNTDLLEILNKQD